MSFVQQTPTLLYVARARSFDLFLWL